MPLNFAQRIGFFENTGQTRQYGYGSPANGSTLSSSDEDGVPYDCYVWNNSGQAPVNFSYNVTYPQVHQGQTEFSGAASNPLETQLAQITWDMKTNVTTSGASATGYVNYNHTCYPAHQIKVNGQVIYSYIPPHNDTNYIFECLSSSVYNVTGQTSAVSVPVY